MENLKDDIKNAFELLENNGYKVISSIEIITIKEKTKIVKEMLKEFDKFRYCYRIDGKCPYPLEKQYNGHKFNLYKL